MDNSNHAYSLYELEAAEAASMSLAMVGGDGSSRSLPPFGRRPQYPLAGRGMPVSATRRFAGPGMTERNPYGLPGSRERGSLSALSPPSSEVSRDRSFAGGAPGSGMKMTPAQIERLQSASRNASRGGGNPFPPQPSTIKDIAMAHLAQQDHVAIIRRQQQQLEMGAMSDPLMRYYEELQWGDDLAHDPRIPPSAASRLYSDALSGVPPQAQPHLSLAGAGAARLAACEAQLMAEAGYSAYADQALYDAMNPYDESAFYGDYASEVGRSSQLSMRNRTPMLPHSSSALLAARNGANGTGPSQVPSPRKFVSHLANLGHSFGNGKIPNMKEQAQTNEKDKEVYSGDMWNLMFERLMIYKAKHGNCHIPLFFKESPHLGTWAQAQRRSTSLSSGRREKLLKVGFFDSTQAAPSTSAPAPTPTRTGALWEKHWNEMFERLQIYKKKHGDCMVPFHCAEDPQLGYWVKNQRFKKDKLSQNRLEKLKKTGFQWDVAAKSQNQLWQEMFSRLTKFEKQNGHCFVPSRYKEDPKLGNWVHRQRHVKEKLSEERKAKLDTIGFM